MKLKLFIVYALVLCALFSSCSIKKIESDKETDATSVTEITTPATEKESVTEVTTESSTEAQTENVKADAPAVGLYNMVYYDPGVREEYELQTDYKDDGSLGRDICVLGAYPTTEEKISGQSMRAIFNDALEKNPDAKGMKIGYLLRFTTTDGECEKLILRPSDITDDHWENIEIYIYDDINQTPGAWYSHLLESEVTDDTIVTSIKLTAGEKIGDVKDIRLTAFLYKPEDAETIDSAYATANGYTANIEWYAGRA